MDRMAATSRLRVRTAGAALPAGALLSAGCAGTSGLSPAAATGESTAPASGTASPQPEGTPAGPAASGDLRSRLLPAPAFGDDATVVEVAPDQMGAAGAGLGGWGGHRGDHGGHRGVGHRRRLRRRLRSRVVSVRVGVVLDGPRGLLLARSAAPDAAGRARPAGGGEGTVPLRRG